MGHTSNIVSYFTVGMGHTSNIALCQSGALLPHCWHGSIDINRTPICKTRQLSPYQLTHDKVMQAWISDIHAAAQQEPTGVPVFLLYSTQSSSYIYRYTVLIRDYYYIAIYT